MLMLGPENDEEGGGGSSNSAGNGVGSCREIAGARTRGGVGERWGIGGGGGAGRRSVQNGGVHRD
jgi:hypothetical protein